MARMIPPRPKEFTPQSLEGTMFDALEKHLPDDYYVLHSFAIVNVSPDGIVHESETDFVIFSREKGLLCLEAKAGNPKLRDGLWYYGNGKLMPHDGPFEQARRNKHKIKYLFAKKGLGEEYNICKRLHAVWFPSISRCYANSLDLPSNADRNLLMTKEDLDNPLPAIERIFNLIPAGWRGGSLTELQVKRILNEVLCPAFDFFISSTLDIDLGRAAFRKMIDEQIRLLDFLEDQPSAAIYGAAGTGKTVIAIEKAQRCALAEEKVLFLCFNRFLKDYLTEKYDNPNIDFFTIDGLAAYFNADIASLPSILEDLFLNECFPYKHVIVDEGQDFGQERMEEAGILETLSEIALSQKDGTFYVFYDKMQLVQCDRLPKFIEDAECRIVLRRNCRNTKNIAATSLKPLRQKREPIMKEGGVPGEKARFYIGDNKDRIKELLDDAIRDCINEGYDNIVILTCRTLDRSFIVDQVSDGYYRMSGNRVPVTTCRKFKGLEADAIILIDVGKDSFVGNRDLMFYVGASRARLKLNVVAKMSDAECIEVLRSFGRQASRRPRHTLASELNMRLA